MLWIVLSCTAGAGDSINLLSDGISDTGVGDEGGGQGTGDRGLCRDGVGTVNVTATGRTDTSNLRLFA